MQVICSIYLHIGTVYACMILMIKVYTLFYELHEQISWLCLLINIVSKITFRFERISQVNSYI